MRAPCAEPRMVRAVCAVRGRKRQESRARQEGAGFGLRTGREPGLHPDGRGRGRKGSTRDRRGGQGTKVTRIWKGGGCTPYSHPGRPAGR